MKHILLITYHFPPDAAVGAVRPAEFAQFFPEYDWFPVILTVKESSYDRKDPDRYNKDMSRVVCRTSIIPNINELYLKAKSIVSKNSTASQAASFVPRSTRDSLNAKEHFSIRGMIRRCYNSIVYLPDYYLGWLPCAFAQGLRLCRRYSFDAFLTTGPPQTAHLVGLMLKGVMGKVWIADFRDPWAVENKPHRSRTVVSDWLESKMERAVVKRADWIISVTPQMTERLKILFPEYQDKCITIFNGFDAGAMIGFRNLNKYDVFTISYVGSLYFGRDPSIFLQAIAELLMEGKVHADEVHINFIGDCRYSDDKSVERMVKKLGLCSVVTFTDKIPQAKALEVVARSHVALLIASDQPLQIPAKVYEYIGLRVPILCVAGKGATRELLIDHPASFIVYPEDLPRMKEAVVRLFNNKDEYQELMESSIFVNKFERRNQVKMVAKLLQDKFN